MKKNKMGLKIRLVLLVLIALIPLIILHLMGIQNQYERSIQEELKSNIIHAQNISITFMNYLEENWVQQYSIGEAIISNPQWQHLEIKEYMDDVITQKRTLEGYAWISPEGITLVDSNSTLEPTNVQDMEFYKRIIEGEPKVVSNLEVTGIDDRCIVYIARGIYDNNELKGIILGVVNVEKLGIIFDLKLSSDTARYGLIDNEGMMVHRYHWPDMSIDQRQLLSHSPAWTALEGEVVTSQGAYCQFEEADRIGGFYPMEDIGWVSYYTISTDEVIGQLRKKVYIDAIILLSIILISLLVANSLGERYIQSIQQLKNVAEEVYKGNLTIKADITESNELAATSEAFNRMTEEIHHQISQLDEIVRLKTHFFSTVSHELKTPINIILGSVQLMENMNNIDKASLNKYLKMQKQNSYRLLRLINNLIDINKIEGKEFIINPINCNIVTLIEDIITSIVEYTKLKNIELIFDTDIEEKVMAVDPDMIERIILNLISNAIKFTEPGGKIQVTVYDKGEHINIVVKDTGIGIPDDMQHLIFEYFTQVNDSLHRQAEGSGIGLSLVKSLVTLHKGSIRVNSEEGKGSEFIIELPVSVIENTQRSSNETSFTNVERTHIEFSDIYIKNL